MALFEKPKETAIEVPLTSEMAEAIYNQFKLGKSFTELFVDSGYDFNHSLEVWNEIKRLESDVINYVITDTELSSKEELMTLVSSEMFDVSTVIDDVILYNPTYQEGMTFQEFVDSYRNNM